MKRVVLTLFVLLFLLSTAHADLLESSATSFVTVNGTINITGTLNTTTVENQTISVIMDGTSNSNTSNTTASGTYSVLLTAAATAGDYTLNVSHTNASRVIPVHVTDMSAVNINFTTRKPPFNNGTSFVINTTFDVAPTVAPNIRIFSVRGAHETNWTVDALTATTGALYIEYNITIPEEADGTYIIVFENGLSVKTVFVRSSLVMSAATYDTNNAARTTFSIGESVIFKAKIRDGSGPVSDKTITGFVTYPSGTFGTVTLTETSVNGTYSGTFPTTATEGTYKVLLNANVNNRVLITNLVFDVRQIEAKLDIVDDFFFEFGSSSAFQAGGQVAFNILIFNKTSNDTVITGSSDGASGDANCSATSSIGMRNVRTGADAGAPGITNSIGNFFGQPVCQINFTAPSQTGLYALTMGVSLGNGTVNTTATGFFSVQNYILKVSPVSSLGGGSDFLSALVPGDNATFEIQVRNLSDNGAAVPGNLVSGHVPVRIKSLNFLGPPEPDITSITVIDTTPGTASSNPRFIIKLPDDKTGPFLLEAEAQVGGETITGSAFYFAKYVDGFMFPLAFGEFGESTGGKFFKCGDVQEFKASLTDVRTRQAARNVIFNSIQAAREEITGKDISQYLSIITSTPTDSNGEANINVSIDEQNYTWSGFYFFLLNVTTNEGNNDIIPAGFECRTLDFFPQITTGGGGDAFSLGPSSTLVINISDVVNLSNGAVITNGTITILELEGFSPSSGSRVYPVNSSSTNSFNLTGDSVVFNVTPSNFLMPDGKWPNGFNMMQIRFCDNNGKCDTSEGHFRVVAFDLFPAGGFFDLSLIPGENETISLNAKTNITNFTLQMGRPWEGYAVDVTSFSLNNISDTWDSADNNSCPNCFENWNITFTVPSNVRKGFNMMTITGKNYLNETSELMLPSTVTKFTVTVPDDEGVEMSGFGVDNLSALVNYSIDMAVMESTYGISSKSGWMCARQGFDVTRFGPSSASIEYNTTNTTIIMVDNGTSNDFDYVVINSSGTVDVISVNSRELTNTFPGLYLRDIYGCGFFTILNSTADKTSFGSGFGGQHEVDKPFMIPFVVKQGTTALSGMDVRVFQIIEQENAGDSGGRGGFGFKEFLDQSNYTNTTATTDSNGIAFVQLNLTRSGLFSLLWRAENTTDSDTAEFFNAVQFEAKLFNTWGGMPSDGFKTITLVKNDTETRNATAPGNHIFVGTWNETAQGELFDDVATTLVYIALRNMTQFQPVANTGPLTPVTNGEFTDLVIDDDEDLCTNCSGAPVGNSYPVFHNWTRRFGPPDFSGNTFTVDGNNSVDENRTQIVLADPDTPFERFISNPTGASRSEAAITVRVCAETFDRPTEGLMAASVKLQVEEYSAFGPPSLVGLTMYSPYDGSQVSEVLTGPSGCAVFNVTNPNGGWLKGFSNIKGNVTYGSNTETVFVGNVNVGFG